MSKPTLYIHIGPHKTGTTTIQNNLTENRDALAKRNYIYPETRENTYGHHQLAVELNGSFWHEDTVSHLEAMKSVILGSGKNVILSSEAFSNIRDTGPLEKLRAAFQSEYDIKIILYLRQQDQLLPSLWKTDVMLKTTNDPFSVWLEATLNNNPNLYYDKWLALHKTVFGGENILPQVYKPNNPAHFPSFLKTCNIPESSGFNVVGNSNISFSDYMILISNALFMNEVSDDDKDRVTKKLQQSPEFHDFMKARIKKERHIIGRVNLQIRNFLNVHKIDQSGSVYTQFLLNKVLATYKDSNQRVSQKYFGTDRIFTQAPPSDFIERNFFRRMTKAQLIKLCNLAFTSYRREEMFYAESIIP